MSMFRLKGTSGEVINRKFPLQGKLVIGRADDCDIRIDQPGVAPRHAEVSCGDDGSVLLKNLDDDARTLLNGEPVAESLLAGGDEIRIGTCRWMLQAPGLRPDRVLTPEVVASRSARWPWLLAVAVAAAAALAWQRGWLAF